jgi:predicted TIM-barrel fold metal-dependent hydrolase
MRLGTLPIEEAFSMLSLRCSPILRSTFQTRRQLLAQLASLPLASCIPAPNVSGPLAGSTGLQLVDAHCHLFNITDLPAASFSQIVFFHDHEKKGGWNPAELALREALDGIEAILSTGVTTAAREAQLGPGLELFEPQTAALSPSEEQSLEAQQRKAEAALAQLPRVEQLFGCDEAPGPSPSLRSIVTWLRDLRARRSEMTRRLAAGHATSGYNSRLLCPALVDYSNWLVQKLRSPLPDQMRVGGVVGANTQLPPVHGYMAFDPLRRALVRERLPVVDGTWDPLALVREALVSHGFIGVKLYPPMGFQASGNASSNNTYPPHIEAAFGSSAAVGSALDESLDELWQLCEELDAPVMAHAHNSNEAGAGYGRRADPTYWVAVAKKHPNVRIMLAHFGSFRTPAAGRPVPRCSAGVSFEDSWEAVIGQFVRSNPNSNLYADVSYLAEVFHPAERERSRLRFQRYLQFDPGAEHLIFGSDWVMLGIEKGWLDPRGYARQVASFLHDVGLDADGVNRVMYSNSLKFLGLNPATRTRTRLAHFYAGHGIPESRLPT